MSNDTPVNFSPVPHLMSMADYARACGVKRQAIYERVQRKVVAYVRIHGEYYIDASVSPPAGKVYRSAPRAGMAVWPQNLPPSDHLVCVSRFCAKRGIRADRLFRSVLYGKLAAWGIGQRVFVKKSDALNVIEGHAPE